MSEEINLIKEKSCGCIIIEDGKTLLINDNNNNWGFPKGHAEGNETEQETALREVKEETNLDVKIVNDKRYVIEYITDKGILKTAVYFIAKKIKGEIVPQEEEINEIEWLKYDEAINILSYDNIRDLFKEVLNDIN